MFLRLLGDTPSHEATHRQEEPAEVEQVREKLKPKKRTNLSTQSKNLSPNKFSIFMKLEIQTKLSALRCRLVSALAAGEETRKHP